jgi:SAM-dependent methyltransferase
MSVTAQGAAQSSRTQDLEMAGDPQSLQTEYRLRFGTAASYRNAVWEILCAQYFNRFIAPTARVLDVGAGWCEFINNITAAERFAMDLNPDTGTHVAAGVAFLQQDCSEEWKMPGQSLDVVFTSNFLEHLLSKDRVARVVAEAHRVLVPNGLMICMGPNIRYLPGTYWDFWDHSVPISEKSMSELLRMAGFEIELCVPRFLPYSISGSGKPPLVFLKLYLRLPFLWSLFGRQFLVVGRKTSTISEHV